MAWVDQGHQTQFSHSQPHLSAGENHNPTSYAYLAYYSVRWNAANAHVARSPETLILVSDITVSMQPTRVAHAARTQAGAAAPTM